MKKPTLTVKTPAEIKLQDFVFGGEKELVEDIKNNIAKKEYPWEHPSVRYDVKKNVHVILPEEYRIKLEYLSKTRRMSMNKIASESIIAEIEKMLKEDLG